MNAINPSQSSFSSKPERNGPIHFSDFPAELILHCFSFLGLSDKSSITLTSRRWGSLAREQASRQEQELFELFVKALGLEKPWPLAPAASLNSLRSFLLTSKIELFVAERKKPVDLSLIKNTPKPSLFEDMRELVKTGRKFDRLVAQLKIKRAASVLFQLSNKKVSYPIVMGITLEIGDLFLRGKILEGFARSLFDQGKTGNAKETALAIPPMPNDFFKSKLIQEMAISLCDRGDIQAAKDMALSIENELLQRDQSFKKMAKSLFDRGDVQAAKEMAFSIKNSYFQSESLKEMAISLCGRGDIQSAKEMALTIENIYLRAEALKELAKSLFDRGDIQAAKEMLLAMGDYYWRSEALIELAMSLFDRGDIRTTKEFISHLKWNYKFECFYSLVFKYIPPLIKQGRINEGMKTLYRIWEVNSRFLIGMFVILPIFICLAELTKIRSLISIKIIPIAKRLIR